MDRKKFILRQWTKIGFVYYVLGNTETTIISKATGYDAYDARRCAEWYNDQWEVVLIETAIRDEQTSDSHLLRLMSSGNEVK